MKTFEYRGFDQGGRRSRGLVEADDPSQAREKLAARGILCERLAAAGDRTRQALGRGSGFDRPAFRAAFYRELGSMLRSGIPLAQALDILVDAPDLQRERGAVAAIRDRIREGEPPHQAVASAGRITEFERATLETGARVGELDAMMEQLADYLDEMVQSREKAVSSLIYPVLVAVLAVLVALGMFGFLLPSFARLWEETRVPMHPLTRGVMAFGRVLGWMVWLVIPLGAAVWIAHRDAGRAARWRARRERMLLKLPRLGDAYAALLSMRFARTLALLLRGGVPLLEAMTLAGRATGSPSVAGRVADEAEQVRHGGKLSDALRRIAPFSRTLPGWVQAGEAGGELPRMLDDAADRCRAHWERDLTRALALLEPVMIIVMGGFVLILALAIILPIFSLNQALQ